MRIIFIIGISVIESESIGDTKYSYFVMYTR